LPSFLSHHRQKLCLTIIEARSSNYFTTIQTISQCLTIIEAQSSNYFTTIQTISQCLTIIEARSSNYFTTIQTISQVSKVALPPLLTSCLVQVVGAQGGVHQPCCHLWR
jgi:hypothetical protein